MDIVDMLLIFLNFIFVVIFLTILFRIASGLDQTGRALTDIARDLKKLTDKGDNK